MSIKNGREIEGKKRTIEDTLIDEEREREIRGIDNKNTRENGSEK